MFLLLVAWLWSRRSKKPPPEASVSVNAAAAALKGTSSGSQGSEFPAAPGLGTNSSVRSTASAASYDDRTTATAGAKGPGYDLITGDGDGDVDVDVDVDANIDDVECVPRVPRVSSSPAAPW